MTDTDPAPLAAPLTPEGEALFQRIAANERLSVNGPRMAEYREMIVTLARPVCCGDPKPHYHGTRWVQARPAPDATLLADALLVLRAYLAGESIERMEVERLVAALATPEPADRQAGEATDPDTEPWAEGTGS